MKPTIAHIFLLYSLFALSCTGQNTATFIGDPVSKMSKNIMLIHQDKNNHYWFASWDNGLYRFDGKTLVNYTTKHGLHNNRIDDIKEDQAGNIYFASANHAAAISKFNGKVFTTIKAIPSDKWKLESTDLWLKYSYGNTGKVYRFDGENLFEMKLPKPPHLSNPFDVYSIYKDRKGNLWFGTNPVGVCRFDGKSFDWITEEDVTEFRNEGANGVRSITEDKNGDFWFNTEFRYRIYDSTTIQNNQFYTRIKSIGGLDGKEDSDLDEFLSTLTDREGNLWFVTYLDGVWKYDGEKITHFNILDNSINIKTFSIYQDNVGNLWVGTHENGVYKFNGTAFEKFIPE